MAFRLRLQVPDLLPVLSVLAIESHREQAVLLRDLVAKQIQGPLTLVDSVDEALAAMDRRVPSLIVVNALMPPHEEAELIARLRGSPILSGVEVLFSPVLANPANEGQAPRRRWFKSASKRATLGCAPSAFAEELELYLDRVRRIDEVRRSELDPGPDRRSSARVSQVDHARLVIGGSIVNLVDLSVTGAQIVSRFVLRPGRLLDIELETGQERNRCQGEIVWGSFELLPASHAPCYRAGVDFRGADHRFLQRLLHG